MPQVVRTLRQVRAIVQVSKTFRNNRFSNTGHLIREANHSRCRYLILIWIFKCLFTTTNKRCWCLLQEQKPAPKPPVAEARPPTQQVQQTRTADPSPLSLGPPAAEPSPSVSTSEAAALVSATSGQRCRRRRRVPLQQAQQLLEEQRNTTAALHCLCEVQLASITVVRMWEENPLCLCSRTAMIRCGFM